MIILNHNDIKEDDEPYDTETIYDYSSWTSKDTGKSDVDLLNDVFGDMHRFLNNNDRVITNIDYTIHTNIEEEILSVNMLYNFKYVNNKNNE
jgi:hypothetical protein